MKSILFLHGALGDKEQFKELEKLLKSNYHVYSLNFNGHGHSKRESKKFTISKLAEDVIAWMDIKNLEQLHIFGYSMGGYVGLWLARYFPERVKSVVTLGTKLKWDINEVIKEVKMLDSNKIEIKVPTFAELLRKRHGELQWKIVLSDTIDLMNDLGERAMSKEDFESIQNHILLCRGEVDAMVSQEETMYVANLLLHGKMIELNGYGHSFDEINSIEIADLIKSFLKSTE